MTAENGDGGGLGQGKKLHVKRCGVPEYFASGLSRV